MKCLEIIRCTFFLSIREMLCNPAEQACVRCSIRHVGGFSIPKHLRFKSLLRTVRILLSKKGFFRKDCSLLQWEMEINNSAFKELCFFNAHTFLYMYSTRKCY